MSIRKLILTLSVLENLNFNAENVKTHINKFDTILTNSVVDLSKLVDSINKDACLTKIQLILNDILRHSTINKK